MIPFSNQLINPESLHLSSFLLPGSLWAGFFLGVLWGFVLQKATVCKYDVVVRFFMLRDFTVHKMGITLLIMIMVMLHLLHDFGIIKHLVVPETAILGQIVGGLIMGAGIAISGYCPGTSAAALGEGAVDAFVFMLGMAAGSAFFAEFYPFFDKTIVSVWYLGNVTLPELLGINQWLIIALFILFAWLFEITVVAYWEKRVGGVEEKIK